MSEMFSGMLLADGPASGTIDRELFGQFVGSWDLEVSWFEEGRPTRRERGEWHFAWVLGGRAIQDVWIVPPAAEQRAGAPVYEYGSSLRFPDASGDFWRSTWHGPVRGMIATFIARRESGDIVLEGQSPDEQLIRWVFFDIAPDRFRWRNERAAADGDRWEVMQDFIAVRRR